MGLSPYMYIYIYIHLFIIYTIIYWLASGYKRNYTLVDINYNIYMNTYTYMDNGDSMGMWNR